MVAMLGWIIPAPLAIPPIRTGRPSSSNSTAVDFGRVSVVMMASAAASPPSGPRAATASAMPSSIFSMGSGSPMTPVEHTRIEDPERPSASAARSAIRRASR